MNPGIDGKPFEIVIYSKDFNIGQFTENDIIFNVISKPERLWKYDILYYLSLGLYDRRGYIYKVKIIK